MRRQRLLWRVYRAYLAITLLSLLAVGWFAVQSLDAFYLGWVRENLRARAELVEQQIGPGLGADDVRKLQAVCARVSQITSTRLTVIAASGQVLCDTHEDPARMQNHRDRPEVQQALAGEPGEATHYSATLHERMMYLAIPVRRFNEALRKDEVTGAVRAAVSVAFIDQSLRKVQLHIAAGGLAIAALAAVASWFFSRQISRPLEEMKQGAEHFARGQLDYKLPVPDSRELAGLADSLNVMARQLDERIATIVRQRREQEAVLAGMVEGVLAVDAQERIITLNKVAAELLRCDREKALGRSLQEVVRSVDLRRFVTRALAQHEPAAADVVLPGESGAVLEARSAPLLDARGQAAGVVIVLNDATRLRQLENIRRDFAANVSHELRTPITSIKGFVETLLDGALANAEETDRFLKIIARQADRLSAIIEDLLSLARIEREAETGEIVLEEGRLRDVLQTAIQDAQAEAAARNIALALSCPDEVVAVMNPPLLEQAVANLLDNAIKYSEPGNEVRITAARGEAEVTVEVSDTGCGIAPEHFSRLFERFYRVDKARSRKLGGTGLGLAIVKHIVQAHQGRVTVQSRPGAGSTFTIHLPGV
jgi:two-component system, OmpR family, phosphate regulon sensor histidine kinase PhoR